MNNETRILYIEAESADLWNTEEGWQFNYCWCDRVTLAVPAGSSDASITRRVKAALGLAGRRCYDMWRYGDGVAQRVAGTCVGFNWRCVD